MCPIFFGPDFIPKSLNLPYPDDFYYNLQISNESNSLLVKTFGYTPSTTKSETWSLQILGKLKWSLSQTEIYENMCGGRIMSANETELKLEASVTNAKNGQLVRAHASSIIYKKNFRMDFSLPSPAVIHPDMPFMAWVIIDTFRILFSPNSTFVL